MKADLVAYNLPVVCTPGISLTIPSAPDNLDVLIGGGSAPHTNEQAKLVHGDVTDSTLKTESKWQFRAAL